MADAGAIRAGDRLPWLEPYRPPSRKPSNRKSGLAATIGVAGLIGIAAVLTTSVKPPPEEQAPTTQVVLPPPSAMQPQPAAPVLTQKPQPVVSEIAAATTTQASTTRYRPVVRRRINAEPTRDAYGEVMDEQADVTAMTVTEISPEALAIAALPAPPADPPRPAVNPSAQVVRGKTVQLGVFKSARQAEIAWRSAIRDYTYLVTMPKSIEPIRMRSKRYYLLQLGTPSKTHARQLCGNLKQIGRACTVA
jgi:hypothetical protein